MDRLLDRLRDEGFVITEVLIKAVEVAHPLALEVADRMWRTGIAVALLLASVSLLMWMGNKYSKDSTTGLFVWVALACSGLVFWLAWTVYRAQEERAFTLLVEALSRGGM